MIILVILLAYYSFYFPGSSRALVENSESVNILAPFSISFLSRDFKLITFAGLIMMLCDISSRKKEWMFHMVRMNLNEWYRGQVFCLITEVVGYFCAIFMLQFLFYIPAAHLSMDWGNGIENYTYFTGAMNINEELLNMNVIAAFMKSFALVVALGLLFGSICMLTDTTSNKRMGPTICVALMVWNLVVQNSENIPKVLSPVGLVESYAGGGFIYALVYYLVIVLILLNTVKIRLNRGMWSSLV